MKLLEPILLTLYQ